LAKWKIFLEKKERKRERRERERERERHVKISRRKTSYGTCSSEGLSLMFGLEIKK
jgi:hypothetical protein